MASTVAKLPELQYNFGSLAEQTAGVLAAAWTAQHNGPTDAHADQQRAVRPTWTTLIAGAEMAKRCSLSWHGARSCKFTVRGLNNCRRRRLHATAAMHLIFLLRRLEAIRCPDELLPTLDAMCCVSTVQASGGVEARRGGAKPVRHPSHRQQKHRQH